VKSSKGRKYLFYLKEYRALRFGITLQENINTPAGSYWFYAFAVIQWRYFPVWGLMASCESDVWETKVVMIVLCFKYKFDEPQES
jgi:hypothetical protein